MINWRKDVLIGAAVILLIGWTLAFLFGKGCLVTGKQYHCVEVTK